MVKAAKKRKKEEDEEFAPPEFDEAGYLRKEVESAKVALVGVALAVPVAGLLYALTVAGVAIVAFFLGLAFVFLLPRFFRVLPWPPVDTAKFERRDWIGHGGTFFLSVLAFWILFLNVPFADVTAPVITGVTVYAGANTVSPRDCVDCQAPDVDRVAGNNTWINATISENERLDLIQLFVGNISYNPTSVQGSRHKWSLPLAEGSYSIRILAEDDAGHAREFAFRLNLT